MGKKNNETTELVTDETERYSAVLPDGRRYFFDINIDQPRYNLDTYWGRAKHFFQTTNPLNILATTSQLERAKTIVEHVRKKECLDEPLFEDDVWDAKVLYDSAFHPDTGEKMVLFGRMSAQVPCNMLITGAMCTFYKSTAAVVFWQWVNQSFNALVNFTNRSGDATISDDKLLISYLSATTGAVVTAVGLNKLTTRMPTLVGRCVPFVAVGAANCINIPLMRSQELEEGTPIYDDDTDEKLGYSKTAARSGISQVIVSRIGMAFPGMVLTPVLMDYLENRGTFCRYPWMPLPLQTMLIGFCLTFATPLCCAFFKQKAEIKLATLEPELIEDIKKRFGDQKIPKYVYYNKGL